MITEQIFAWNGIGQLAVDAAGARDPSLMMGIILITGTAVLIANIIADVAYAVADPRVRYEQRQMSVTESRPRSSSVARPSGSPTTAAPAGHRGRARSCRPGATPGAAGRRRARLARREAAAPAGSCATGWRSSA